MKVIINAMLGSGNLGDDLISYFLLEHIKSKFPESEISVLSGTQNNPLVKSQGNITVLNRANNKLTMNNLYQKRRENRLISSADKIIVGGGGLIQDVHHVSNISYWTNIINMKSDNYLLGIGMGPIKYKTNIKYLTNILRYYNIQVRDEKSKNIVEMLGAKSTISTDIVAGSDISMIFNKKYQSENDYILGIAVRPWLNLSEDKLIELINYIIIRKKIKKIHLFTFEYSVSNLEEYEFNHQLKNKLKNTKLPIKIFTYNKDSWVEFKNAIEIVDFGIASRLHANVIWQKMNIPVIPISYDDKVNALYKGYEINDIKEEVYSQSEFINLNLNKEYELPDLCKQSLKPSLAKNNMLKLMKIKFKALQIINSFKIRVSK